MYFNEHQLVINSLFTDLLSEIQDTRFRSSDINNFVPNVSPIVVTPGSPQDNTLKGHCAPNDMIIFRFPTSAERVECAEQP